MSEENRPPLFIARRLRNRLFLYFACYLLMIVAALYVAMTLSMPHRLVTIAATVAIGSLVIGWGTIGVVLTIYAVCPRCGTSMFITRWSDGFEVYTPMLAKECTHCGLNLRVPAREKRYP